MNRIVAAIVWLLVAATFVVLMLSWHAGWTTLTLTTIAWAGGVVSHYLWNHRPTHLQPQPEE